MFTLDRPVEELPRVGEKYGEKLKKLGIKTARELLWHFPFRYDDFSKIAPVAPEYVGQIITVAGTVKKTKLARIFRRRMTIAEVVIQDENNIPLKAVWFNQPYILDSLAEGVRARFSGKLEFKGRTFSMVNPAWEKAERAAANTGRLVPVYPETKGLSSKWLRWQLQILLRTNADPTQNGKQYSSIDSQLADPIPAVILKKLHLPALSDALRQIHFPENREKLLRAQKRFAFSEMFLVQLKSLQVKLSWKQEKGAEIKFDEKLIQNFVGKLPFKLTDAQRKASFEILKDLEKPHPMNRLLNGDVGSGKTIVAAIAALQTANTGYQVALMAPTEVLARQHFLTLSELLKNYDVNITLLTNSYKLMCTCHCECSDFASAKERSAAIPLQQLTKSNTTSSDLKSGIATVATLPRNDMLNDIKSGKINLIIGTHALIQESVKFKNLALLIVDEQHRFGVAQRAYLQQEIYNINDGIKNKVPHLLSMTATPIPRTLSLAFFGNLDLSVLDEMPKNRKKIITRIINPAHRQKTYAFIQQEIRNGRQVFVIFPLIEESKVLTEIKAATVEHKKLAEIFPEFRIGLLHGKLKSKEKETVMEKFKNKEYAILVSTSVIEVGIDIPNASVMMIEDADRFGLSQLHQFRGRVGRSEHQSYCFLFTGSSGETATNRLQALEKNSDGFAIAEADLRQRGPGEFFGTRQSGLPDIAMENLANVKLIQIARAEALHILQTDPTLKKHPLIANALQKFSEKIHLE